MDILDRPLWRDYSRWQGQVNFDIVKQKGIVGMAARSSISWGKQDSWFPRNWKEAGRIGIYRTSYHIVSPGANKMDQLDNWYSVHPNLDTIPRVIDIEVNWNDIAPERIAHIIWDMSEEILRRDGVRPWIYSRLNIIEEWFSPYWSAEQFDEHYWWLAQYDSDAGTEERGIVLPEGISIDNVILKQTASKKAGFSGEAESGAVDYDRWMLGDEQQMHNWIDEHYGDAPKPEPTFTQAELERIVAEAIAQEEKEERAECKTKINKLKSDHEQLVTKLRNELSRFEDDCNARIEDAKIASWNNALDEVAKQLIRGIRK